MRSAKPLAAAFSRADIDGQHAGSTRPRGRQRDDSGPGADVGDTQPCEIKTGNEAGQIFAGDKITGVKNGGEHDQAKPIGLHHSGALPLEHKVVGREMDGASEHAARQRGLRATRFGPTGRACALCDHLVHIRGPASTLAQAIVRAQPVNRNA
jgi:hypothetical protein